VVRPQDTNESLEDIEKRLAPKKRAQRPSNSKLGGVMQLKLNDIRVAERAFQWRSFGPNQLPSDDHILEMARALHEGGDPLAPITVFAVAGAFYVIDGHHRLAAYHTARWERGVPARLFDGTLDDAWRESLRCNVQNKLPMTKRDKINAAWIIVKKGDPRDSIRVTMKLSGVGKGTVNNMRRVWKKLNEEKNGAPEALAALSWGQALGAADGTAENAEYEDWLEAEADKLVNDILRAKLGGRLTKNPDVTAMALMKLNEDLPAALTEHWREPAPYNVQPFAPPWPAEPVEF
jgi:hypothetical protein